MWRSILLVVAVCSVLLVAATSRSDSPASTTSPSVGLPEPEPTLEPPVVPAAGSAVAQHDPFRPYDIGPSNAAWAYEALTPEEQGTADRGAEATGWDTINNGYAAAVRGRSVKARAQAAAQRLGIDHLGDTGVIP